MRLESLVHWDSFRAGPSDVQDAVSQCSHGNAVFTRDLGDVGLFKGLGRCAGLEHARFVEFRGFGHIGGLNGFERKLYEYLVMGLQLRGWK